MFLVNHSWYDVVLPGEKPLSILSTAHYETGQLPAQHGEPAASRVASNIQKNPLRPASLKSGKAMAISGRNKW